MRSAGSRRGNNRSHVPHSSPCVLAQRSYDVGAYIFNGAHTFSPTTLHGHTPRSAVDAIGNGYTPVTGCTGIRSETGGGGNRRTLNGKLRTRATNVCRLCRPSSASSVAAGDEPALLASPDRITDFTTACLNRNNPRPQM